ncbi:ATP-binding cassette domain-containing protein [Spirochaetota bacterium]
MNGKKEIVQLKNMSYSVGGHEIFTNVNETVYEEDIVFILGKSGMGKSAFLKLCAGLMYPASGDIVIRGISIPRATNEEIRGLHTMNGYVFQDCALISNMSVYENLELPLRYHAMYPLYEIHDIVMRWLERMNLTDDKDNRPAALSTGEQKLAAIARALINRPSLLYMDEPMSSLDRFAFRKIIDIIQKLKERRTTMLIVSHELELLKELGGRIWYIDENRIALSEDTSTKAIEDMPFFKEALQKND